MDKNSGNIIIHQDNGSSAVKKRQKPGILKLDISKPRRSSGSSVEFREEPELLGEVSPASTATSPPHLSVTWASSERDAEAHNSVETGTSSTTTTTRSVQEDSKPTTVQEQSVRISKPLQPSAKLSAESSANLAKMGDEKRTELTVDPMSPSKQPATEESNSVEEDYSATISAIMQRRASIRGHRKKGRAARRPSTTLEVFDAGALYKGDRRRSSVFTTSSGDTAISVEDATNQGSTQEQIYENIRLHKEVIQSIKHQPWTIRRKLKLVRQAKTYIARHQGALQERFAMSRSTKDLWARFKIVMAAKWKHFKREIAGYLTVLIPWELRIKQIESHFGSGVASYFTFLRWLLWVNIMMAIPLCAFVIIPELLGTDPNTDDRRKTMTKKEFKVAGNILTFWEFEGYLKYSPLFYGYYSPETGAVRWGYDLPLAYFLTSVAVYVFSFFATLRKMAQNSRLEKLSSKDDECVFSWKLFTGWDFMIGHAETAHNRIASVVVGFKEALLEEAEKKKDKRNWKVLLLRIIVNMIVVVLLAASGYCIVIAVERSENVPSNASWLRRNEVNVIMTLLSFFLPMIFDAFGLFENWHPRQQLRLQLARIMILNLLNLYSLMFGFIYQITTKEEDTKASMKIQTEAKNQSIYYHNRMEEINDTLQALNAEPIASSTTPADLCRTIYINCSKASNATTGFLLLTTMLPGIWFKIDPTPSAIVDIGADDTNNYSMNDTYLEYFDYFDNLPEIDEDYFSIPELPERSIRDTSIKEEIDHNNNSIRNLSGSIKESRYEEDKIMREKRRDNSIFKKIATNRNLFPNIDKSNFKNISFKLRTPIADKIEDSSDKSASFRAIVTNDIKTTQESYPHENETKMLIKENPMQNNFTAIKVVHPERNDKLLNFNVTDLNDFNYTDFEWNSNDKLEAVFANLSYVTDYYDLDSSLSFGTTEDDSENCTRIVCIEDLSTTVWTTQSMEATTPSTLMKNKTELESQLVHYKKLAEAADVLYKKARKNLTESCWETTLGQELSKVIVFDTMMSIALPLIIDFLRALFVRYMNDHWCWDMEKTFPQYGDFKIAESILNLVYNQGQVWMGIFFSPGLVLINLVKLIILMYLRSWIVLTCNVPHELVFKASKSNNFYLSLLLTMLFLCVLPVGFAIVWLTPSSYCGPFSNFSRVSEYFTTRIKEALPKSLHKPLEYMTSSSTVIPLLLLLILVIYYLLSLTGALREANQDLKNQLQKERMEERRKMLNVPDEKPEEPEGNAISTRWKRVLDASSPLTPTTPSSVHPDTEEGKTAARKEMLAKIMKRAFRKGSETSDDMHGDDETDNEHNEPLPRDEEPLRKCLKSGKKPSRKPSILDIVALAKRERSQSKGSDKEVPLQASDHDTETSVRPTPSERRRSLLRKQTKITESSHENDDPNTNYEIVNEKNKQAEKKIKQKSLEVDDKKKVATNGKFDTRSMQEEKLYKSEDEAGRKRPHSDIFPKKPSDTPSSSSTSEHKISSLTKEGKKRLGSFLALVKEAVNTKKPSEHEPDTIVSNEKSDEVKIEPSSSTSTKTRKRPPQEEKRAEDTPASTTSRSEENTTQDEDTEDTTKSTGPPYGKPAPYRQDSQASIWSDNIPVITISKSGGQECILESLDAEPDNNNQ